MKRGLPLGPTLLVAVALPVLVSLGVWQLNRLAWKEDLLVRLAEAPKLPVLHEPVLTRPGLDFRRAIVPCRPIGPPAIRGGRSLRGEVGYSYILRCTEPHLSLDAGWSPRPDLKPFALAATYPGLLREHPGPDYTLISTRALPPLTPSAPPSVAEVPNSHLSYAIQWFLFAGVLAVIYGVYVMRWRAASLDSASPRR